LFSGTTDPHNGLFRAYDPWLYVGQQIFLMSFALLTAVGLAGLYTRYGTSSGLAGRIGLLVGSLAGLIAFGASAILVLAGEEGVDGIWSWWISGLLVMFGGLALFGVPALRRRLLGGLSWAPLVTGVWFLGLCGVSIALNPFPGEQLTGVLFAMLSAGLVQMGRALLHNSTADYEAPLPAPHQP
jgi:hypothetical protein